MDYFFIWNPNTFRVDELEIDVIFLCFGFVPVPNQSNTADKNGNPTGTAPDPNADPEQRTFYENLPFHGMQNPPNKVRSVRSSYFQYCFFFNY